MKSAQVTIKVECECGRTHQKTLESSPKENPHQEVIDQVLDSVSKKTGIATSAILGPSRTKRVARARGIVIARLRDKGLTLLGAARAVNLKSWTAARDASEKWKGQ